MTPERKEPEYELSPAQDAWLRMVFSRLLGPDEATTKAEWDWYGRILNLPEEHRQRAINSVWEQTIAEKASEHLAGGRR